MDPVPRPPVPRPLGMPVPGTAPRPPMPNGAPLGPPGPRPPAARPPTAGAARPPAPNGMPRPPGPAPQPGAPAAYPQVPPQQAAQQAAPAGFAPAAPAGVPPPVAGAPRPASRPKRVYASAQGSGFPSPAPANGAPAMQAPAQFAPQGMPGTDPAQGMSPIGMPPIGPSGQPQFAGQPQFPGQPQFAYQQATAAAVAGMQAAPPGVAAGIPPPPLPGMAAPQPQRPLLYANPPQQPTVSPLQQAQMIAATQPSAAPPVSTGPRPGISPKSAAPNAPRPRIDPNQIPSPVAVQDLDQKNHEGLVWSTASRTLPPLASTDVRISDDGNASPRLMRITTYNIPATEELCNMSHLPLGLVIQPLAELRPDEDPIQLVDFGENGPVRCNRCRGYINPMVRFVDGGQKWACNLCEFANEVPPEYFCNLDMTGRRMDHDQRPELRYGTVEFVPTKEYYSRPAHPAAYVFAIDVSWSAVQSGMLARFCRTLKGFLYEGEGLAPGCDVGIVTFDRAVHFYNLSPQLDQAHMMVIPDVMDVFAPLNAGFLVNPAKSRSQIEALLDSLPSMFEGNRQSEPALSAAVEAAMGAMKDRGGKLSVFQTALPTFGPHPLKNREDIKLLNSDKERQLYEPQDAAWKKMATHCAEAGIGIDLYIFPSAYVDVATVGLLSAMTGGTTTMYQSYDDGRDGLKFANDLVRNLRRPFAFDVILRVRASNGLRVAEHHGNFYMKNSTDLEFAGLDSSKAFAVTLKYDSKLDERTESAFQCAMLYTAATGERRIRVSTLSVPSSTVLANVFRFADMDTSINYLQKTSVAMTASYPLRTIRDELTVKCVKILAAYRKHCGSSTAPGQLILPESFKLYPLYTLALLKMKSFRGGQEIPSDVRVFNLRTLKALAVSTSVPLIYPRLFAIHEMPEDVGQYAPSGRMILPPNMRVSLERMEVDGAYILENGFQLFLWIGRQISQDFLRDVFGVDTVDQVQPSLRMLPELDNRRSQLIRAIVDYVQNQRYNYMQLQIVRHQIDPFLEVEYNNMLVEDKNQDNATYVDYLCSVHRQIQVELSG
ncbi:Sec23/Sec24 trunk domain-containing protein [Hyaloraphidium curvatum]|nr:Sec23/Sec24 trunk domain-containing protein [Hyaloraphidium curvatum]